MQGNGLSDDKQAKFNRICEAISSGKSVRAACNDVEILNRSTFNRWLKEDEGGELRDQYARAKQDHADAIFDECIDIADNHKSDVHRARLMIDTRKWMAGKIKPKVYSDKLDLKVEGDITVNIADKDADCG